MGSNGKTLAYSEVNIVVPVYKVEAYVERCVESVSRQSYKRWILFLVDDGSPLSDASAVDEYALQDVRVLAVHQRNGGLSAARNSGIDLAFLEGIGKWITFIDGDDWVHEEYLGRLLAAAKEHGVSVAVAEHDVVKSENDVRADESNASSRLWETEDYWVANRTNATTAWGKLYRLSIFDNVRYPNGRYHEDEFVTYRILFSQATIAVVAMPLYYYFYNSTSISRKDYMKRFPDVMDAFTAHYDYFLQSTFKKAFRLEKEKYAEALSNAIWYSKKSEAGKNNQEISVLRWKLKSFLAEHGGDIPFETRKDIYIAAYPSHEFFIRIFGLIKARKR